MASDAPRGSAPGDVERFGEDGARRLREAVGDLAWLLGRAYSLAASLALVGDRHGLDARARLALQRGVAAPAVSDARRAKRAEDGALAGAEIAVDAFNLVVTLEVALARGPVFVGRDGAARDLAGLRGSYRPLPETDRALGLLAAALRELGVARVAWWVDAPVSNAAQLAAKLRAWHDALGLPGDVTLVPDADRALAGRPWVASSDGRVIDEAASWVSLAARVVRAMRPAPWLVELA